MVHTSGSGSPWGDPDNQHGSRYESRAPVSSAGATIRIILEGERCAPAIHRAADAPGLPPRYVPRMPRKPPLADVLLAAVLAAVKLAMVATSWEIDGGSRPLTYVAALLLTVPLAWRRVAPLLSASIVFGALGGEALLLGFSHGVVAIDAILVASYSVAAHSDDPRAAVGGLALGLLCGATSTGGQPGGAVGNLLVGSALFLVPWFAGLALRSQRLLAARLQQERDERAHAAVAEERARIARELHDEVAHSVSVIAVQADAAEAALAVDPRLAGVPVATIKHTARGALVEMRRLLGALRENDRNPALAPQPRLADVERLVEQTRAAGVETELHVEGEPQMLPASIDLSAYRIVQEALTNVLKHAQATRVVVVVRYGGDGLELEIVDDGVGRGGAENGGYGLLGIRERVELYGGRLSAAKREGGGYALRARLPLAP
jgi:signal transduction histidine kinase